MILALFQSNSSSNKGSTNFTFGQKQLDDIRVTLPGGGMQSCVSQLVLRRQRGKATEKRGLGAHGNSYSIYLNIKRRYRENKIAKKTGKGLGRRVIMAQGDGTAGWEVDRVGAEVQMSTLVNTRGKQDSSSQGTPEMRTWRLGETPRWGQGWGWKQTERVNVSLSNYSLQAPSCFHGCQMAQERWQNHPGKKVTK